ncbi:hypothetical protein [uncultured Nocardioides sp.]|uniref:hypothetical protein n=1 Tax=uncultured Nocardioides sp. TaxID=198441 RepID=UPI0025E54888|nr:hypothetical protein [uncultured Nocardioides sp.]
MTEQPESPGVETHVGKPVVAGAQGALDATFNAHAGDTPEDVEADLRQRLAGAGVLDGLSAGWVGRAAAAISAGDPVVAELDEPPPGG